MPSEVDPELLLLRARVAELEGVVRPVVAALENVPRTDAGDHHPVLVRLGLLRRAAAVLGEAE